MQRFNLNWTAKSLVNQMARGKVNYDNAVQRNLVWDNERKSLLIHSMVYGYAIPAMYFTKDESGVYDSLDGKQRSNAISEFMNNEFALAENTPLVVDEDGATENISGLCFSQLPEWVQDRIKDYSLTIYYYEDMTESEVKEFFRRLNNGKPLSAIELTRANTPCLEIFQQLARHEAIQFVVSQAGKNRFTDEMIAMQLYYLITVDDPDFTTKSLRAWVREAEIDSAVLDGINAGLDSFMAFVKGLEYSGNKKILRTVKARTHFISCVYFCYLAVIERKSDTAIYEVLSSFFSGRPSTSSEYNHTVSAGSAKPAAVQTRRDIMKALVEKCPETQDEPTPTEDEPVPTQDEPAPTEECSDPVEDSEESDNVIPFEHSFDDAPDNSKEAPYVV